MNPPSARAGYTKLTLRHLKNRGKDVYDSARARVDGDLLEQMYKASSVAWLPLEVHAAVANAVRIELGPSETLRFWTDVMIDSFGRVLMQPLVRGALALYGKNPASLMRMTPQAWSLVWRDAGTPTVTRHEDGRSATIEFHALHDLAVGCESILTSFVGNAEAALEFTQTEGKVSVDKSGLKDGRFVVHSEW